MIGKFQLTVLVSVLSAAAVPAAACSVTVGWESMAPFAFKAADSSITGLDTEIAQAIAARAGCTLTFKEEPWARTLKEIESGETTAGMDASRTPEREQFAAFTRPYRQEAMALVVPRGSSVKSLKEALAAGKVGVVNGYEYGDEIKAAMAAADTAERFEPTPNDDTNLKKVAAGRLSAAVVDPFIAAAKAKALDIAGAVQVVSPPINADDVSVIISKKAGPEIFKKLDDAVAAIKADGTLDKILASYVVGS